MRLLKRLSNKIVDKIDETEVLLESQWIEQLFK